LTDTTERTIDADRLAGLVEALDREPHRPGGEPLLRKHFPAGEFAEAWLDVWNAVGDDKDDPDFYRRVLVEWHLGGIQLVAVSPRTMLRTWVPIVGSDGVTRGADLYELDEYGVPAHADTGMDAEPDRATLIIDEDALTPWVARQLAKWAKVDDKGKEHTEAGDVVDPLTFTLELHTEGDGNQPALMPELERLSVRFVCHTGLVVPFGVSEQAWVDWRAAYDTSLPEEPTSMLTADTLKTLAKLKRSAQVERHGTSWWLARSPVLGVIQSAPPRTHLASVREPSDEELEELEHDLEERGL
jgi:hypothetical protein